MCPNPVKVTCLYFTTIRGGADSFPYLLGKPRASAIIGNVLLLFLLLLLMYHIFLQLSKEQWHNNLLMKSILHTIFGSTWTELSQYVNLKSQI